MSVEVAHPGVNRPTSTRGIRVNVRSAVTIAAFHLMLWKFVDLRFWPHLYAGQSQFGSDFSDALTLLWLGASATFLLINSRFVLRFATTFPMLAAFLAFAAFHSLVISQDLGRSFQLTTYYWIISVVTFAFVISRPLDTVFRHIAIFGAAYIVANLISLAFPQQAYMVSFYAGLFRGFTAHKNDIGFHLIPIIAVLLFRPKLIGKALSYALLTAAAWMQIAAFSVQTVLIVAMIAVIWLSLLLIPRHWYKVSLILTAAFSALVLLAAPDLLALVFDAFGKDTTLTGRSGIWEFFIRDIESGNYFGYGLGVFFTDPELVSTLKGSGIRWIISTAHSSFLEAAVALGLLGGALFATATFQQGFSSLGLWLTRPREYAIPFVLIWSGLIGGFSATEKLFSPGWGWLVFMIGVAILHAALAEAKSEQTAPVTTSRRQV